MRVMRRLGEWSFVAFIFCTFWKAIQLLGNSVCIEAQFASYGTSHTASGPLSNTTHHVCVALETIPMAKPGEKRVTPTIKKRAVGPVRPPNSKIRSREHLTQTEVENLSGRQR